ncbi:hypothetical protein [Acidovorax sp. Root219]|uniref:hypothetical protein n=1 Tax=Acidovorax sp. Root219 TaxID=1736493 RepID=UPI000ACD1B19|nr:hypothetical protein [Acidovorax sp. Root219]
MGQSPISISFNPSFLSGTASSHRGGSRLLKVSVLTLAIAGLQGCGPNIDDARLKKSQDENVELKKQIALLTQERDSISKERNDLKDQVKKLSQTPGNLMGELTALVNQGKIDEAQKALGVLQFEFPKSPESAQAYRLVTELRAKIEKQQEQARQLEALGFKALKPSSLTDTNAVKVTMSAPTLAKQFVFDRYDGYYHFRTADRDTKFVVANLSATAKKGVTDPELPGYAIYRPDGKTLRKIADFSVEFSRWGDYGSYLGNHHDTGNDFAKTSTITFAIGAQVTDEYLGTKPLYIVSTAGGCMKRRYDRFSNPPVSYSGYCSELADVLSQDDLAKLTLVRRID